MGFFSEFKSDLDGAEDVQGAMENTENTDLDSALSSVEEAQVQSLPGEDTQEGGDDCRRRFIGTQAVGIGGRGDGSLQQGVVLLHGGQDIHEEGDELKIAFSILSGSEKQSASVCTKRPVVVFTRTVHSVEGLLVQ